MILPATGVDKVEGNYGLFSEIAADSLHERFFKTFVCLVLLRFASIPDNVPLYRK